MILIEPCCKKTCLRGLKPCMAKISLLRLSIILLIYYLLVKSSNRPRVFLPISGKAMRSISISFAFLNSLVIDNIKRFSKTPKVVSGRFWQVQLPSISKFTRICIGWWGNFGHFSQLQRVSCRWSAHFSALVFNMCYAFEMKTFCV